MYPRALTPVMASLVFGTSVQPSFAYADESYDLGGDSARLGADGYEVTGVIETQEQSAQRGASYHGPRIPVPTAYSPRIVASEDTCMGSRSFGLQLAGFGVSFGTTWQDRQCMRIKNARQLNALGYQRAAIALLCQDDEVFDAMERAGTPCPGLELVTFEPPPPEVPAEPPLISFDDVLFDFDRATLRPEADAILAPALELLQADPAMAVEIEGHTDWIGSDGYNDGLSRRRAQAVVEWLVARGIERERISAVGRGESEPVATNATAAGRQLNRRVEVRRRAGTSSS
ncbi:OmpA family protein [Terricaulis silvestris]|uniref:Root adhesin n=1 Tax=Terricaulis silvestris TaxID=2686094 RepID=A0A6I6ML96_9CAUL|nr:OmpA family protein [Terricaulis silvestris]QGZ95479.1 Root adhesin [Terricaulis silvestris]